MISLPKVTVTGATGFIGGRIVERLVLEGRAEVTALIRDFGRAVRVARFPVRMVRGTINAAAAVEQAVKGSQVVFHCAMSVDRASIVEGTRTVCQAALAAGVKRLVYFSTVSVYGTGNGRVIDERTPHCPLPDAYSRLKNKAEEIVRGFIRAGLPALILQPTVVYGPGGYWSTYVAGQLRRGTVMLPAGGRGASNAVYVDDVVDAAFQAAFGDSPVGETFLIAGPEWVSWREYYAAYAAYIPGSRIAEVEVGTAMRAARATRRAESSVEQAIRILRTRPDVRRRLLGFPIVERTYRLARALLPERLWERLKAGFQSSRTDEDAGPAAREVWPPREHIPLLAAQQPVSIEHARRVLGYRPRFSLADGVRLTAEWLRWAGELEGPHPE
jgi:nucleoside-diphosphate-sugar epimerase